MDIKRLLQSIKQHGASDLHLQVDSEPIARIHGQLAPLDMAPLTGEDLEDAVSQIADEAAQQQLADEGSADFAYLLEDAARFRINAFRERGRLAIAFRLIPLEMPTIEGLKLPQVLNDIALIERGLVLVTGTTGSGKSSTLAAMLNHRNQNQRSRIITIEDPIEFLHQSDKSLIAQRQIGPDTKGFSAALRVALRQDPDVILVGELRDVETMRTALQAGRRHRSRRLQHGAHQQRRGDGAANHRSVSAQRARAAFDATGSESGSGDQSASGPDARRRRAGTGG